MIGEPEIRNLAETLVRRHGGDARLIATQARLRARQQQDMAMERAWDLVLGAIKEKLAPPPHEIGSAEEARRILVQLSPLQDDLSFGFGLSLPAYPS